MVNLPVYGDSLGGKYNYTNTSPVDTHTCTNLPDGRQNCLNEHFQCDASLFNMTTRTWSCAHFLGIAEREICDQNDCISLDPNAPIPPKSYPMAHPLPMNMSNSTVPGTPTPAFQNTTDLKNTLNIQNQIVIHHGHFSPNSIQVSPGSTITWTNNDTVSHRIMSGMPQGDYLIYDGIIDSGPLAPGQSFQIVENDVGTIQFYTALHNPTSGSISNAELQDFMNGTVEITKTPALNSTTVTTNLLHNSTALNQTFNAGPKWMDKIFGWYENGNLTENELFSFVKWMIDNKIIGK